MTLDQTTIGELYTSLAPLEIKQLDGYIRAIGSDTSYRLHKCFARMLKLDQMKTLNYDDVKQRVFRSKTMVHSSFTTEINLLSTLVKEYLILAKTKEKNLYTETLWGEILIERGLRRNQLIKLKNYKLDIHTDQYALQKDFYHHREKFFYTYSDFTSKNLKNIIDSLNKQLESFEKYLDFQKFELYIALISLTKQLNKSIDSERKSEILNYAKLGINSDNEILKLQALVLALIIEQNKTYYTLLFDKFINQFDNISLELKLLIFPNLSNFCISMSNKGDESFQAENFKIQEFIYHKNLFFTSGFFSLIRFYNFINYGLRFKSVEFSETVFKQNLKYIPTDQKSSFEALCYSKIEFAKGHYKEALRYISRMNPNDSIYYFPQYKIMLIKCHVMLENVDRLQTERDNFYKYVHKNSNIPEDAQGRHFLFIRYADYLLMGRYPQILDHLRQKMETALLPTSPYFTEKEWVRERWNHLKEKYQK